MYTNRHSEAGGDISRVSGRDLNPHFMRVDTAREQRDRHFSRAREGEVACERETNPQRQQTHIVVNYLSRGASAPAANQQSRSGAMLSSGVGGGQKRATES